jgi:hypothetical protein
MAVLSSHLYTRAQIVGPPHTFLKCVTKEPSSVNLNILQINLMLQFRPGTRVKFEDAYATLFEIQDPLCQLIVLFFNQKVLHAMHN